MVLSSSCKCSQLPCEYQPGLSSDGRPSLSSTSFTEGGRQTHAHTYTRGHTHRIQLQHDRTASLLKPQRSPVAPQEETVEVAKEKTKLPSDNYTAAVQKLNDSRGSFQAVVQGPRGNPEGTNKNRQDTKLWNTRVHGLALKKKKKKTQLITNNRQRNTIS